MSKRLPLYPPCVLTETSDKPELHLSSSQKEIFAGWKRPRELLSEKMTGNARSEPVMSVSGKVDLVQDMLTDCSVVASLCATTARAERWPDKVREHPDCNVVVLLAHRISALS